MLAEFRLIGFFNDDDDDWTKRLPSSVIKLEMAIYKHFNAVYVWFDQVEECIKSSI